MVWRVIGTPLLFAGGMVAGFMPIMPTDRLNYGLLLFLAFTCAGVSLIFKED